MKLFSPTTQCRCVSGRQIFSPGADNWSICFPEKHIFIMFSPGNVNYIMYPFDVSVFVFVGLI